jgi:hypothetical protein
VISAYNEDRLIEVFGAATSSSIKPISRLVYKDVSIEIPGEYPFANYINDTLINIKTGSPNHQWITSFE